MKKEKCVICEGEITVSGNSAEPVADGLACDVCYEKKVLVARLKAFQAIKYTPEQEADIKRMAQEMADNLNRNVKEEAESRQKVVVAGWARKYQNGAFLG